MNDKAQKACTDAIKFLGLTDAQSNYFQVVAKEIFFLGELSGLIQGQKIVETLSGKEELSECCGAGISETGRCMDCKEGVR